MLPLSPTSRSLIEELQSLGGGAQTRYERVTTICKIKPQAIIESPQFHSAAKSKTPESQSSHFAQTPESFNSKLMLSTQRQNTYIQLSSKQFSLKVEEKFRDGSEFKRKSFAVDRVIDPLYVRQSLQQILLMKGSELNLLDYLWKGFNASLITFGDSDSGKSFSIFQKEDGLSLLDQLVHGLFTQIEKERLASQSIQQGGGDPSEWNKYLVGFTMFEIQYRNTPGVKKVEYVVDLLNSSSQDNTDADLLNVIVATELQLLRLLEAGMKRSKNFDKEGKKVLKNKAHLFLRIMLYDTEEHQISTFHLVDMIGNRNSFKLTDDPMEMGVSSGLAAFKQMVAEMARQCKKNQRFPKLKASRHSKLTQLVSPLLCGNSKSIILGCVSSDSKYENICGTMDLLEKAAEISVQLRRNDTVKRKELSFVYFSSYAQRHLSSLQRETRSKVTPHKGKADESETVTVADLQEQSLQKVQKTYEWINDFQQKKEERLKEAVQEAKRANTEMQKLRNRSVSSQRSFTEPLSTAGKIDTAGFAKLGSGNASLGSTVRMLRIKEEIASLMNKIDDASKSVTAEIPKQTIIIDSDESAASAPAEALRTKSKEEPKPALLTNQTMNPLVLTTSMNNELEQSSEDYQHRVFPGCSPIRGGTLLGTGFTLSSSDTPQPGSPFKGLKKENILPVVPESSSSQKRAYFTESKHPSEGLQMGVLTSGSSMNKLSEESQAKVIRGQYYLLRQNYQSVQSELRQSEQARQEYDQKVKMLEQKLQEQKMSYELQNDDIKLKNIALYSKLRVLQENSELSTVFEVFNSDLEKLQGQLEQTQQNVVSLVKVKQGDKDSVASLKKITRGLQKEITKLTKENQELKSKGRSHAIQQRIIEESTRKANYFKSTAQSARAQAQEKSLDALKSQADLDKLTDQMRFLKEQNQEVLKENAALIEEISLLRDFAYNTDNDALRKHYHNFVSTQKPKKSERPSILGGVARRLENRILPQLSSQHEQKEVSKLIASIIFEGETLSSALSSSRENEDHLIDLLTTVQEKFEERGGLENDEGMRKVNKELREILMRKTQL